MSATPGAATIALKGPEIARWQNGQPASVRNSTCTFGAGGSATTTCDGAVAREVGTVGEAGLACPHT
eukprot:CAMPEP_0115303546 /NCGR_PEP_ID=MMETSP0270-20121206/70978_1 /TAXON_ID=71861 /ORGANISM="Scrippsiella trochoidea, Strain CCMP3099" /LENGTH=66 /DNA_ID=CAMNT_0002721555 /DNA_START=471 /DNA_END=671 /DNA_ORIENTATION=-